ncbi:ATP-binding cassette transporter 1 [Glomus cerebriforme]|uniref:ATP-binding cassette transporter 1 n=1 Tax=Glomus cerebriforme TaxID=658196 RepID=A0A397T6F1_9GLOM|nr:ATP-binding cassette transporter 1 [Glomus cerebriforme]
MTNDEMFCHDEDGWGPWRPNRPNQQFPDFTMCFEEGAILTPINLLLIILGFYEIYRYSKKHAVLPLRALESWHYVAIKITIHMLITLSIINFIFAVWTSQWLFFNIVIISSFINVFSMFVAYSVYKISYTHSHVSSSILLLYWLFYLITHIIKLRTLILMGYATSKPQFFFTLFSMILVLVVFVLELLPKPRSDYELIDGDDESFNCPEETANIFSRVTFYWMTPLMKLGHRKFLTIDDLWNLDTEDQSKKVSEKFEAAWNKELKKKNPSLLKAIAFTFGSQFAFAAVFKASQDCLNFVQPQLLGELMRFVNSQREEATKQPAYRGYCIAILMFLTAVIQTIFLHQYFQLCFVTGMRIRAGLVTAIYQKSFKLSNGSRQKSTVGEIVNHMSVDAQKIMDLCTYLHIAWSGPLQIILALYFLYQTMGISIFAGVGVMIMMIPVNAILANKMKILQKIQMKNKDERIKLMNEILNGIKVIKLYAWEQAFLNKIFYVRNDLELKTLKRLGYLYSVQSFTWTSTPFLVSFATFLVFVMFSGAPLNVQLVFVAIPLFNLLQFPLTVFPSVITAGIEAIVASRRIENFLRSEELDPQAVIRQDYHVTESERVELVSIKNGDFKWNKLNGVILEDINLNVRKRELVAIVGKVGAGKSSLLSALLGEMEKIRGEVIVKGHIAYVPQSPWIMNATLRDNITFGYEYDPDLYNEIIEACALKPDIAILPGGDLTEIGEKGINLSGGQKARVALARAVYAGADVYLFDDPLSAVDAHVGKHIFDKVIGSNGILRTKARIFVTHGIHYLSTTDSVVMMRDGRIVEQGHFDSLMKLKSELFNLITEFGQQESNNTTDESEEIVSSPTTLAYEIGETHVSQSEETVSQLRERRVSVTSLHRRPSLITVRNQRKQEEEIGKDGIITKEEMAKGSVSPKVYTAYAKSCGISMVIFCVIMLIISQGIQVATNIFLKYWSSQESNENILLYFAIYGLLGLIFSIMTIFQTILLWVFCAIRAARKLHQQMLHGIIRSPMSFFDTTPLGRILNRFSKDIYTIDELLPRIFVGYFRTFFVVISTIFVITYSTPLFIIVIIPMIFMYIYIQTYYLSTSRELKRLDSVTRSPIYAHFQETLGGLTTIRAYQQVNRFITENEIRLDVNQKAYFPSFSCNRWLAVRLEFLGSIIIFGAAIFSVITVLTTGNIDAGLVGLSVSYALSVTQALNWAVRQFCEIETNIVSVERVKEYIDLPSEAPVIIPDNRPDPTWPQNGLIKYQNYSTRYRQGLELVLKGVSFIINPREKVGIVGRTGAGKSSLTLSLFRLIEAVDGSIIMDGVDISKIGLYDLRSRLTIIPQDPILFEGTVAFNLDPFGTHEDVEIWQSLQSAHLKDHVSKMEGKLQAKVLEGGDNFSQGQRQLLCLARALLRRSNVIVLDEATACVDVETDFQIQNTIRTEFNWATLLCIAHRLRTIIDYDRVLVLDEGNVSEFDTPYNLLQNPNGLFRKLCEQSNEFEYLKELATKKHNSKK